MSFFLIFDTVDIIPEPIDRVCIRDEKRRYIIKRAENDEKKCKIDFYYLHYYKAHG